nr:hypothetical protein [uncultured Flavobacterium sp.]
MFSKVTSSIIKITTKGIILELSSKKEEQIPFTDIAKIHIKVQHRNFVLKSFYIGHFIFTLVCLQYLSIELSIFSTFIFVINIISINIIDFKTYHLQIILKDNTVIGKKIPKKWKFEFIPIINEVRNQVQMNPVLFLN